MYQKRSFLRPLTYLLLLLALLWGGPAVVPASSQAQSSGNAQAQASGEQQPAQTPQATPQQSSSSGAAATDVPGAGVSVQNQPQGNDKSKSGDQPEEASRITKQQAKELFRSVDEILQFASNDTGLPIKRGVKRKLITRESVSKYISKRINDDKDTQRLERSQLVLEKFGLLPPGYDLHKQFLLLLGEQVAAYYEPKSRSVNMLDWVQPEIQKPVLAHELTHALQDQTVDLQKWPMAGEKDDKPLPDQQEEVVEEAQAARQCVTEGQAMVVLFDYSLEPLDKNVVTAPEIVDAMRGQVAKSDDSPVFTAAPMFLRESLMMPYTFGLDFVRTVLANKGKEAAFAGMLQNPPVDTRQVMQPETYLLQQVVQPPTVPDLDRLVAPAYERFDFGAMGEFDVYLLARQYGGADEPKKMYPHWRGGYYFAAHDKAAPKDQIAMLYFSRWDSPEVARKFRDLYASYLAKRYKWAKETSAEPATAVGASAAADQEPSPAVRTFATDEGKVSLEVRGNDLLILEGFDDLVSDRARQVILYGMSLPSGGAKKQS